MQETKSEQTKKENTASQPNKRTFFLTLTENFPKYKSQKFKLKICCSNLQWKTLPKKKYRSLNKFERLHRDEAAFCKHLQEHDQKSALSGEIRKSLTHYPLNHASLTMKKHMLLNCQCDSSKAAPTTNRLKFAINKLKFNKLKASRLTLHVTNCKA